MDTFSCPHCPEKWDVQEATLVLKTEITSCCNTIIEDDAFLEELQDALDGC